MLSKNNKKKMLSKKPPHCVHCQNLKIPSDHWLRKTADPNSEILCPVLLMTECKFCFELGHTVSHCPMIKQHKVFLKTRGHNVSAAVALEYFTSVPYSVSVNSSSTSSHPLETFVSVPKATNSFAPAATQPSATEFTHNESVTETNNYVTVRAPRRNLLLSNNNNKLRILANRMDKNIYETLVKYSGVDEGMETGSTIEATIEAKESGCTDHDSELDNLKIYKTHLPSEMKRLPRKNWADDSSDSDEE